ncbi:MAG: hypothetical protein E6J14_14320 [Chloroflexi bacterium]|nr:MAG: hypothetical protein E6J14_14320 [Chloroflexota bacterium]
MPTTINVTSLNVSGPCYDNVFKNSVTVSMSGAAALLSCSTGDGTVSGSVSFTVNPPSQGPSAFYLGGPDSTTLTIVAPPFLAGADLAWTTGATTCPLSPGAASTGLLGTFTYVYL